MIVLKNILAKRLSIMSFLCIILPATSAFGANIAMPWLFLLLGEKNVVEITSTINSPTTWNSSNIYVIENSDIGVEDTLTIAPGTIVKFRPDAFLIVGTNGKIIADGTASRPIVFTSYKDDAYGGDTNGDGTSTTPAAGDWYNINLNGEQDSVFNYCRFYYGGGGGYLNTLELWDARSTVTNCIFAHNTGGQVGSFYDGALDASNARTGTIITGNRFYDNVIPISIGGTFSIDNSNSFKSQDSTQTNIYNGIFYNSSADITLDINWQETEVAFVIHNNDLWITTGHKLSLGNDVVLKFMDEFSTLLLADGESALVNHGGPGVYFTSYKDDSKKGDTNGDGNVTTPGFGDWNGIWDDTAPIGNPDYFTWPNIHYDSH